MKLVIDIQESVIEHIKDGSFGARIKDKATLVDAVMNGTPIPKGCGRLIDAKALEDAMYHEAFEVDSDMQKWDSGNWIRYKMFENAIRDAKTIVEADKGF